MAVSSEDKERLFKQFRHSLGAPLRKVEVPDELLCTALELAIENYSERAQNWLIEHQWQSLLGKNIDSVDIAFALSVRSQDFINQYSFAYSKQVGLQTRGPWELKKDYIDLESGRQVYQIPANREINQVLWFTPNTITQALLANYGGIDYGFGGGFAQMGGGVSAAGAGGGARTGYYIAPAYDILLMAQDMNLKNRIVRSDLLYKITAGPDGTKLLHLMSTPGSKLSFGMGVGGRGSSMNLQGCQVWYHYYDTTGKDIDECRRLNPDVITTPNEVPLAKLEYSKFNEPTKVIIRQLFFGEAKKILGRIRGKFGGVVGPPEAERTMDWESIHSEGVKEIEDALKRLDERLLRLSSTEQLKRAADEAENVNKGLGFNPLGLYIH